ncbi:MAG: hypothetical protein ABFS45_21590 [Pseudomonadota bacterium]
MGAKARIRRLEKTVGVGRFSIAETLRKLEAEREAWEAEFKELSDAQLVAIAKDGEQKHCKRRLAADTLVRNTPPEKAEFYRELRDEVEDDDPILKADPATLSPLGRKLREAHFRVMRMRGSDSTQKDI